MPLEVQGDVSAPHVLKNGFSYCRVVDPVAQSV